MVATLYIVAPSISGMLHYLKSLSTYSYLYGVFPLPVTASAATSAHSRKNQSIRPNNTISLIILLVATLYIVAPSISGIPVLH
jgi:hypothetical protein